MLKHTKDWFKKLVIYQIYPRSFQDSNGDGIGDLQGICQRLDYLKELGINAIWLSPVYASPNVDNGYDISDYQEIMNEFGTLEDWEELVEMAHARGIAVIMDLVLNHTSDKHRWFQESRKSKKNSFSDYYIWKDPGPDGCPSMWKSTFGGSAWEYVPERGQYYLHSFAKEQPDLNWENPVLRQKLYDMINWWLDKGLAGFRIDAIINIKKDLNFPDYEPDDPDGMVNCSKMVDSVDGVGELLEDLKKHTFEKYDAFTVGEVFNMKADELAEFIGENGHFSSMFDFSAHCLTEGKRGWYEAGPVQFKDWRAAITNAQLTAQTCGFEANIIENHDEPRGVSRFLPSYSQNPAGTKMLATVSILLRGIPFIYQGQEIGMQNAIWNSIDEFNDISTKDQYRIARDAGLTDREALAVCNRMSRDNARTPVQWSDQPNAGFTSGTSWLKINPNYTQINVANQENDPSSVLNYYRRLIALRKSTAYKEVFTYGKFVPAYQHTDSVMAYYRETETQRILVAANFSKKPVTLNLEHPAKQVLLSNMEATDIMDSTLSDSLESATLPLRSCEVLVLELE